ncbi:hypothetical protein [Simiduia aestuariiviva]|uniref:Uncharacterized protein n=1 Tax=Simiduia aestuariiviva TaxID=1510459 RepID=A0A839UQ22_9GAMM|nr:hypothetical protein [Simiduia aestuariiviva]MBB3168600.1 hypothetical protein [Simiduia aestuariiviva]
MKMLIRILDFIKTGKFGPVEIGMSKAKVLEVLGPPDDDTDLDGPGSILLYAWYELFFDPDGILKSIQNDNYNPKDTGTYFFENEKFSIDPWFLNEVQEQNIESISRLLSDNGIKFEIVDYYGRNVLKVNSGVIVDFDEDENENGIKELIGVRYWP